MKGGPSRFEILFDGRIRDKRSGNSGLASGASVVTYVQEMGPQLRDKFKYLDFICRALILLDLQSVIRFVSPDFL